MKRIIPRLDIKGTNLVKGIHLEGLRALGKPSDFAKKYYEDGADELLLMDVVASLYDRNSLHEIISKTSENVFIPITVGGGLRTLEDIKSVLRVGADKVALNTAAIKNPKLIQQAINKFGSSTIVISIEAIKQENGKYFCFTDNGREFTGIEVIDWVRKVQELGAGEIIITSVDNEGTGKGLDEELISQVVKESTIPLIVHGGVGSKEHVRNILENTGVDAVSAASIFHYDYVKNNINKEIAITEGNTEFLLSGRSVKSIKTTSLADLKTYLFENKVNIRYNK
ncbi:imidazole glycerol phosphate synthase cyclase subunit [Flavobacteriaceae bacterium]|nr:imidazole glycerol phosphate synthase cyclase subunit [Flavobacteriaceae bacterium]